MEGRYTHKFHPPSPPAHFSCTPSHFIFWHPPTKPNSSSQTCTWASGGFNYRLGISKSTSAQRTINAVNRLQ